MTTRLNINQWDEGDRPREKFMANGPASLSNAELLAILIGSGSAEENAVELMHHVLSDCNNSLSALGKMTLRELSQYKGIGTAKAIAIMAACELGRRRAISDKEVRPQLSTSMDIYSYMKPHIQDLDVEEAWILLLNNQMRLIRSVRLSHGGLTETSVDVRLVLREALLANAIAIVLCHNHPSNSPRPSGQDDALTQRLKRAADTMRLRLCDHLILTESGYYSYADEGKL